MRRTAAVLLAAATSLGLVAAAPSSSPAATDPCGSDLVEHGDGALAVGPDGGGIPHLDICEVHAGLVAGGLDVTVVVAGDTADRAPTDHWIVNFTLDGCEYAVHTFHNALTDTLNPPTTQLSRLCGEAATVLLEDTILDGDTVRMRVDAADLEAVGGPQPGAWAVGDVLGRTWLGVSARQGPDAVYTWDSTAGSEAIVSGDLPDLP